MCLTPRERLNVALAVGGDVAAGECAVHSLKVRTPHGARQRLAPVSRVMICWNLSSLRPQPSCLV